MDDEQDPQLDTLLRQHFAERLDEHVGCAAAKFEQEILAVRSRPKKRYQWRSMTRFVAAAVALTAAVVLVAMLFRNNEKPSAPGTNGPVATEEKAVPNRNSASVGPETTSPPTRRSCWQITSDEGTVLLDDNTPARKLRRRTFERIQWHNPEHTGTTYLVRTKEEFEFLAMK